MNRNARNDREPVEIECKVVSDDDEKNAIAVTDGTEHVHKGRAKAKWFWIPRSEIIARETDHKGVTTITIPRWLAEDRGLA